MTQTWILAAAFAVGVLVVAWVFLNDWLANRAPKPAEPVRGPGVQFVAIGRAAVPSRGWSQ